MSADAAQNAITAAEQALKAGDFAAYGQAQKDLQAAIKRAVAAQGSPATGSPTASPSPSPSASSSAKPSGTSSPSPSPAGSG